MTRDKKRPSTGKGFNSSGKANKKLISLCDKLMSGEGLVVIKGALTIDGVPSVYTKNLVDISENLQAYHRYITSEQIALLGIRRQFEQFKGYLSIMPSECYRSLKEFSTGESLTREESQSHLIFNWFSSDELKNNSKLNTPIKGYHFTILQIIEYLERNCIIGEQFPSIAYYPPESGFPCLLPEVDAVLYVVNKSSARKDMPVVISGQNFGGKY